jgi:secreted Zn-dependent insulinase-like peptidase
MRVAFLDCLRPTNLLLTVAAKAFEGQTTEVPTHSRAACVIRSSRPTNASGFQVERWYQTAFSVEAIDEALVREWATPSSIHPELQLPVPNEFIPTDFRINDPPGRERDEVL